MFLHTHLIHLPAFFVKEIEAIDQAAEIVAFAVYIGHKILFWIRLAEVDAESAATVFPVKRVEFNVLAGVGGFNFYAFNEYLRGGDKGLRKEREDKCYFFHGLKYFGAKKRGDLECFGGLTEV